MRYVLAALQLVAGTIVTITGLTRLAFVVCYARHLLGGV